MLNETYDEVLAMIPRYSWEIMDEDQRDALIAKVVLPRWMEKTKDGVDLGPKAWAEIVGGSGGAIRMRVSRLKARSGAQSARTPSGPTESDKGTVRGAKSAIKRHPELVEALLKDPDVQELVTEAVLTSAGQTRKRAVVSEQRRELNVYDLFLKVQLHNAELIKHLPDYLPSNEDVRDEARTTITSTEAVTQFVGDWLKGRDIGTEADDYLRSVTE